MEEKTEQETVQETTCSGHEHEHDKPRYGRQNKSKSIYITKIAIVVFTPDPADPFLGISIWNCQELHVLLENAGDFDFGDGCAIYRQ